MSKEVLLALVAIGAAVVGVTWVANRTRIPYPVFLVLLGLAIAFVPGLPSIAFSPHVVFYGFLPPLLYSAAFLSTTRELRRQWLPVSLLATVLVVATVAAATASAVAFAGLGWSSALVLGAVVAPTDPVAATTVATRLHVPLRIVAILEGEGLVNDGVALVVFGLALEAIGAHLTAVHVAVRLAEVVAGGIAIGVATGFVAGFIRRRIHDAPLEGAIALLTAYGSYILGETVHVSGVLAVVSAGLYLSSSSQALFTPSTRLQTYAFWEIVTFLLNAVVFVLLGLEFRNVIDELQRSPWLLTAAGAAVAAAVIVVRGGAEVLGALVERSRSRFGGTDPTFQLRERTVIAWSGMRGAISLAAAESIPGSVSGRAAIVFITYVVIIVTLVGQGTTLPFVIARLRLGRGETAHEREHEVRRALADAALDRLGELRAEEVVSPSLAEPLRDLFEERREAFADDHEDTLDAATYRRIRHELIDAQRRALDELSEHVDERVLRQLVRELDLEQSSLG